MVNFPRTYRLVSEQDFQSVFAKPLKVSHRYLLALISTNPLSHPRLGLVVAKRRLKRAVDRNRFRRIARESFRHHKDMLKGLDIIILIRSECSALDNKAWRDDVDKLWQMISLKAV